MRRNLAFILCALPAFPESFLVAPFSNRTRDARLDWVGESIAEKMREALSGEGLGVLSREDREEGARKISLRPSSQWTLASTLKLAAQTESARAIWGEFDFGAAKDSIRVTACILDPAAMRRSGDAVETGPLENLSAIQSALAWRMLRAADPASTATREAFNGKHPPVKLGALEKYVRGLMAPTAELQHRYFTQAVRLDPDFSTPSFFLGRLHYEEERYREAAAWFEKVPAGNPNFVESNFLLGLSRYELSEFENARLAFGRIEPALPTGEVWNNLGAAEARLNHPGALDHFRKALAADPSDPDYHFNVGYALWKRGDFQAAADRFRSVLDRGQQDQDSVMLLGRCLKQIGPRPGDWRSEGLERLKDSYEDPPRKVK